MTTTINVFSHGTVVSRWDDGRSGTWKPLPAFKQSVKEGRAVLLGRSDEHPDGKVHVRYTFPGGAEVTQERLHSLLDMARATGEPSITLD